MYNYKDHILLFICVGGIFLAAVYHTILYIHRRENLLKHYSFYLWVLLLYLLFRVDLAFDFTSLHLSSSPYNLDEMVQMLGFMFYIRFLGHALFLQKADNRFAYYYWQSAVPVIIVYILAQLALGSNREADVIMRALIRVYLLLFGLRGLLLLLKKRNNLYHYYLAAAAITMIFFGILSSLSMMTGFRLFGWGPFYWLLISYFTDVIFFSAALGYLIRREHQEREDSLKKLLHKEVELQQKELEKMKAVYETREEERLRIARDLHDDMGSTLSSIDIYSKVVASYIEKDRQKAGEYLEKIQDNTRSLMENTNDLIWSLQSNYGQSESIYRRIQQTAVQLLSSANIEPQLSMEPLEKLPVLSINAQKNIWLIFKEAINNACKYSMAAQCIVSIVQENGKLSLTISDNGVGIGEGRRGNGLSNMQRRAEDSGGAFDIQSKPGQGTVVTAIFPLTSISDTL